MSFNEPLTPLEQTPRGSMDSITIANTAGIVKCMILIIYKLFGDSFYLILLLVFLASVKKQNVFGDLLIFC